MLHLALKNPKLWKIRTIVQLLVDAGTDISIQNADGDAPLHIAIANNLDFIVIHTLLLSHADVNI